MNKVFVFGDFVMVSEVLEQIQLIFYLTKTFC